MPLAEWAAAYSNNGVPVRMRFVRATKLSAGTWRLVFSVESSDSEVVDAFLGHFSLIPLAGEGDSHPGSLAAPLHAGQRGGVTLDFALEPTAQPALAFFEDDDFPLCFQVGPLEAGPQEGIHPLSRGTDAPGHFFLAATFAGFAGSAGFSGGFGSWMSS